jgi:hypothetical protein
VDHDGSLKGGKRIAPDDSMGKTGEAVAKFAESKRCSDAMKALQRGFASCWSKTPLKGALQRYGTVYRM